MDPEMIKMATEMMSKMSPQQMAQMQQQAANMDPAAMQQAMSMLNGMTPEQRRTVTQQAGSLGPDAVMQGVNTATSQASAHQKYLLDGSTRLKTDGNRLHGLKQFQEAAEKYKQAVANLTAQTSTEATTLRTSCQSNLASCYLQLKQWKECVEACNAVLESDVSNRKALYRRGQAFVALGQGDEAVRDLSRAIDLSPESEKGVIREKLEEAEQQCTHAAQGVVIEEIHDDGDDNDDDGAASSVPSPSPAPVVTPSARTIPPPPPPPPQVLPPQQAQMAQMAADMMRQDPDMMKKAAEMMAGMSDAEIAGQMAMSGGSGMPGATPEMARAAAAMMKNMSTEQLRDMADQTSAALNSGTSSSFPTTTATTIPPTAADAAQTIRQDPNALKAAAQMMKTMPAEQLEAMAAMLPDGGGVPGGMKIDAAQMKMAAQMMENMSPDEFEKMAEMAQSMQQSMMGGGGGMPLPSAGAAVPRATTSSPSPSSPSPPPPVTMSTTVGEQHQNQLPQQQGGGGTSTVPGAAPRFDPGSLPPDMMNTMRKQLADPAMLRSMQSMLKGMDPASLASMMSASGMQMSPEQAQKMVDTMGGVSDKQLAWIARLTALINFIIDAYQRVKAWALSNGAMTVAVVVLLVVLLLRWLGWW